jgi:hypothetical protein
VGVLQQGLLAKVARGNVFTDQHGKVAARIGKNLGVSYAFQTFDGNGAASANAILECLLLNDTVRVPCHWGASPVGKTFGPAVIFYKTGEVYSEELFTQRQRVFQRQSYPKLRSR